MLHILLRTNKPETESLEKLGSTYEVLGQSSDPEVLAEAAKALSESRVRVVRGGDVIGDKDRLEIFSKEDVVKVYMGEGMSAASVDLDNQDNK